MNRIQAEGLWYRRDTGMPQSMEAQRKGPSIGWGGRCSGRICICPGEPQCSSKPLKMRLVRVENEGGQSWWGQIKGGLICEVRIWSSPSSKGRTDSGTQ